MIDYQRILYDNIGIFLTIKFQKLRFYKHFALKIYI